MPDKPHNVLLAYFRQISTEFTTELDTVIANNDCLHPNQVDGLITHLSRINLQLSAALAILHSQAANHNATNPNHRNLSN